MKKTFTLSCMLLAAIAANAQLPVSHTPGNKQALIEEFTGNTCGYCPDGHLKSDQITSSHPGQAFAINIHSGTYAPPASSSASKDFRTSDGDAIRNISSQGITGYPAGTVNRRVPTSNAPQTTGKWAMSRSYWSANVTDVLAEAAYVNIAGEATLNSTNRQLSVTIEAYYTANAPVSSNNVTLALIQNNIIAYQSSASTFYPAMLQTPGDNNTYKHMHALRDVINGSTSGDVMNCTPTAGMFWSKGYTYTVASTYPASGTKTIPAVLADLELIAFVTEGTGNVIAVCKVPITISATAGIDDAKTTNALNFVNVYPNPMANEGQLVFTLNQASSVKVNIMNAIGQSVIADNLEVLSPGEHTYKIDSAKLTEGIYFVNIEAGDNVITKKISVVR